MSDEPLEYEVVIYWSDADDRFIAEAPELPGCVADGPTTRQAFENAEFAGLSPMFCLGRGSDGLDRGPGGR